MKRYFPLGGDMYAHVFVRKQTPRVSIKQTIHTESGVQYTTRGISLSPEQLKQLFKNKKMILAELDTIKNKLYQRRITLRCPSSPCPSYCPRYRTKAELKKTSTSQGVEEHQLRRQPTFELAPVKSEQIDDEAAISQPWPLQKRIG